MATPLLFEENDLTPTERVSLVALKHQPGYAVLEKIFMAACRRANDQVIKLDPADERYDQKLKAFQLAARERSIFSTLVLRSIDYQEEIVQQQEESKKPQEPAVNRIVKQLDNVS